MTDQRRIETSDERTQRLISEAMLALAGAIDRTRDDLATSLKVPPYDERSAHRAWWVEARQAVGGCGHCGASVAACVGSYEGPHDPAGPACDECCGHGNEDGCCVPLYDEDEERPPLVVPVRVEISADAVAESDPGVWKRVIGAALEVFGDAASQDTIDARIPAFIAALDRAGVTAAPTRKGTITGPPLAIEGWSFIDRFEQEGQGLYSATNLYPEGG